MRLPIEALQLATLASKDDGRRNIEFVQVRAMGGGSLEAAATDGRVLGRVTWEDKMPTDAHDDGLLFLAEDVLKAVAAVPKRVRLEGAEFNLENHKLHFTTDVEVKVRIETVATGFSFPTVSRVMPERRPNALSASVRCEKCGGSTSGEGMREPFGVDLSLMSRFSAWAKACDRRQEMRVQAGSALDPIRIDCEDNGPETAFVVMPCRI